MPAKARAVAVSLSAASLWLVLAGVAAAAPERPHMTAASVASFDGGFDTGDLSQWKGVERQAPDRIRVVASPTDGSPSAARFEVRGGDDTDKVPTTRHNRAEVGGYDQKSAVGVDRWYGWSSYFPSGEFPLYLGGKAGADWQIIKQDGTPGTSPVAAVLVQRDRLRYRTATVAPRFTNLWDVPLERDRWHRFVEHIYYHPDKALGLVELWHDGVQVARANVQTVRVKNYPNHPTAPNAFIDGRKGKVVVTWPKLGLYRSEATPITQAVYHDNFKIGASFEAVAPRPRCQGRPATILGSARADRLTGTRQRDVIVALEGNDVVRGLGGNDVVCGGPGRDKLAGGAGKDVLRGESGNDLLRGESGSDRLFGGEGRDRIFGGAGNDLLLGEAGRDRLVGGRGRDLLRGGPGRDAQRQ